MFSQTNKQEQDSSKIRSLIWAVIIFIIMHNNRIPDYEYALFNTFKTLF